MQKYKDIGFKLTPQRLAILDYLEETRTHPSAEEIYRAVHKRFPTMSFATVYTTLEALKQRGRVMELAIEPNKKRFDYHTEPHHHMVCTQCKRVVDIHREFPLALPSAEKQGFQVTGNHIEFYGICPRCIAGGTDRRRR